MSYRVQGLKSLGLCLFALLGLMAFNAAVAQAGAEWEIKNDATGVTKLVGELPNGLEKITGELDTYIEFLMLPLLFYVKCGEMEVEEGYIESGGTGRIKIQFTNCTVLGTGLCKVLPILVDAKILLVLHSEEIFVLFEPMVGSEFIALEIDHPTPEEPECVIATEGEPLELLGSVLGLMDSSLKAEQLIAFLPNPSLLNDGLTYGNGVIHLSGAMILRLAGEDQNNLWSAEHKTL